MRSFASDNNSGVHPLVMEALSRANADHALGYGDDQWTEEAVAKIKETFTPDPCALHLPMHRTRNDLYTRRAETSD